MSDLEQFPIPDREPDISYKDGNFNIWFDEKLFQVENQPHAVAEVYLGTFLRSEKYTFDEAVARFKNATGGKFAEVGRAIINFEIEREIFDE